ncbi:MAG: hypothetical protein LDL12_02105 [Anaerolinea sp.]|nr:hypothetical protein [Anaerolinea sp.]
MKKKPLVILGGGFAGLRAVYHLHTLKELDSTKDDLRLSVPRQRVENLSCFFEKP